MQLILSPPLWHAPSQFTPLSEIFPQCSRRAPAHICRLRPQRGCTPRRGRAEPRSHDPHLSPQAARGRQASACPACTGTTGRSNLKSVLPSPRAAVASVPGSFGSQSPCRVPVVSAPGAEAALSAQSSAQRSQSPAPGVRAWREGPSHLLRFIFQVSMPHPFGHYQSVLRGRQVLVFRL